MNVGESNAVFTLLGYLCPTGKHDRQIKEEDAARAAVTLAAAANKALSAGPSPAEIGRAWANHKPGPRQ